MRSHQDERQPTATPQPYEARLQPCFPRSTPQAHLRRPHASTPRLDLVDRPKGSSRGHQGAIKGPSRVDLVDRPKGLGSASDRPSYVRFDGDDDVRSEPTDHACLKAMRSASSRVTSGGGSAGRAHAPLLPDQAMQRRFERFKREVEDQAALAHAAAEAALLERQQALERRRKDAMAHAHRQRQAALQFVPLRERRRRLEQKMDAADERRRQYLGRFVARSGGNS